MSTYDHTMPMAMHKGLVIHALRQFPEDVGQMCPGFEGTAEEAIAALEAEPWEWKVGDEYLTDEEFKALRE
jgi:hypothetical protein